MSCSISSLAGSAWTRQVRRHACRCLSQDSRALVAHGSAPTYPKSRIDDTPALRGVPKDLEDRFDLPSKTIRTPVGDLPVSPLMDPDFHEARMRYRLPKAKESSVYDKQKWRRHLERNPWANALATPIRKCPATMVHLPSFFLQDFQLLSHPETEDPWYVPISLAAPETQASHERQTQTGSSTSSASTEDTAMVDEEVKTTTTKTSRPGRLPGPKSYMLARQDLLLAVNTQKRASVYAMAHRKLMVLNHSFGKVKEHLKHAVFREDMAAFVLELMRRRIVEDLVRYSEYGRDASRKSYIVRCDSAQDILDEKHRGQRGSVLWLGPTEDAAQSGPGSFATMDIPGARFGRKIPVHNLNRLLGPENIATMKEQAELFRDGTLFMLIRKRMMDLQLKLWKLEGYLAHPFITDDEALGPDKTKASLDRDRMTQRSFLEKLGNSRHTRPRSKSATESRASF